MMTLMMHFRWVTVLLLVNVFACSFSRNNANPTLSPGPGSKVWTPPTASGTCSTAEKLAAEQSAGMLENQQIAGNPVNLEDWFVRGSTSNSNHRDPQVNVSPSSQEGTSKTDGREQFYWSGAKAVASAAKSKQEARPTPEAGAGKSGTAQMLHYQGYASMVVNSISKATDAIARIAEKENGFVENITCAVITLRIPVEKFNAVFARVTSLGSVRTKSITATNVTDSFRAVSLRLQTAKTSRDRLMTLLSKAQSEPEKLQLLKEIQRLTQEIDALDNDSKTLISLSSFSRIGVSLSDRERSTMTGDAEPVAAFKWVHALSPFSRAVAFEAERLRMNVPTGFLLLDEREHFIAESADSAVFWASKRENEPTGTTRFWVDVVKERLGPEFASVEEKNVGNFNVLRFVNRADKPSVYLVGLHVKGKKLEVVEVYFPSTEHEARYGENVMSVIERGGL